MKEYETYSEDLRMPGKIDRIIEILVGFLLVILPLYLGGVRAWSKEIAIGLSGIICICFILKNIFHPQTKLIRSWSYLPVAIFLLFGTFQLISLPQWFVNVISPNTAGLREELLSDSGYGKSISTMTLSFYPNATRHDLRLILAIFAVFVVVVNTYRTIRQVKRLLTTISMVGGFVALTALAQDIFGNGRIYWIIATKSGAAYSGPFVNHNHYGQFMNLSIGAAIALLLMKVGEDFRGRKITAPAIFEYLSSSAARFFWILIAIISIGVATVFMSLSRGGMAAIIFAAVFTTLVMVLKKSHKGHGWIMAVVALAAFSCVLYTGFDAVCERLSTLRNFKPYEDRWQVLKDLTVCFGQFPVFGTGLGTHSVVYPMYDSSTIKAISTHAENEYAQVLEETGIVGLVLLVILGIIIWRNYTKNVSGANSPVSRATYGLGFGLAAILFQSLTDFGQHIPANGFLSAVLCGLIVALNSQEKRERQSAIKASKSSTILRITGFLGIAGLFLWSMVGADNARMADAAWKNVLRDEKSFVEKGWQCSDAKYAELISRAIKAVRYEPDNVNYRYWLNVYRWRAISRQTDEEGKAVITEEAMPAVLSIVNELDKGRFLCPTFGPPYCILGQIEKFILSDPRGAPNIRKGLQLAPCDAIVCFVAGFDDIMEGKAEESLAKLKKAVAIDGQLFRDVAVLYTRQADRPDLAMAVAGDDIDRLNIIAEIISDSSEHKQLLNEIKEKLIYLLEKECEKPDASPPLLISLAEVYGNQKGKEEKAIELYRRALALNYGVVRWRLNLTKLLWRSGKIDDAIRQANICLKLEPQLKEAEDLVAELSVSRGKSAEEAKTQ
jgi:O-antigen ligase